jgi:hypothetical protein
MLSTFVAVVLGVWFAPVNAMLTLAETPGAQCDLVAVDGLGDRVGIAMPRCTWLTSAGAHTEIAVYVVFSEPVSE